MGGPRSRTRSQKVHGVVDVLNGIDNTISGPAITFQVDPECVARARRLHRRGNCGRRLEAILGRGGEPAPTPVITNGRAYTLRVRFPAANRASLEAMRDTLLVGSTGHTSTLGALSTVVENPGQTEIRRENLQRDVAVTARARVARTFRAAP